MPFGPRAAQLDEAQRRWFEPVGADRLFDTERDPYELRNLIRHPHPEKERLERWLLQKYEELSGDHRTKSLTDESDPPPLEDPKALGYI